MKKAIVLAAFLFVPALMISPAGAQGVRLDVSLASDDGSRFHHSDFRRHGQRSHRDDRGYSRRDGFQRDRHDFRDRHSFEDRDRYRRDRLYFDNRGRDRLYFDNRYSLHDRYGRYRDRWNPYDTVRVCVRSGDVLFCYRDTIRGGW